MSISDRSQVKIFCKIYYQTIVADNNYLEMYLDISNFKNM